MNREELRDQLMAPVLQWTALGRQSSELMTGSLAVIHQRSNRLLRGATLREASRILKLHGATYIDVASLARAYKH